MKTSNILFISLAVLICSVVARPQDEYDDEPEPPKPAHAPTPLRGSPLLRRGSNGRAIGGKTATTTTTTAKPEPVPEEELEYDDQEGIVDEEATVTTTTEHSKKLGSGIVRPFRSNDDLLAILKKRREQASFVKSQPKPQAAAEQSENESTVVTKKPATTKQTNGRKRFNANPRQSAPPAPQENEEPAPVQEQSAPAPRASRRFSSRTPQQRPQRQTENIVGQGSETSQQVVQKPRPYRSRSYRE